MNKRILSIGALIAALILFFAINILASTTLHSARLDLTDGKLYTLSQGARNIARGVDGPITLTLFYNDKQASSLPGVTSHATRVREVLSEYVRSSDGKITLKVVNPEPFSEAEDRATQSGLVGAPTGRANERVYFGLVGVNAIDNQEVIPFFDPQRENFLEYDLSRMIFLLGKSSEDAKKTLGLMSWINMEGSQGNPMMGSRGTPPWAIDTQLKELFNVKPVATNATEIPADIKALVVVHPKTMSDRTQYALDQFVLRGGRLLLFIDPLCEGDVPPGVNPMQAMSLPKSSDLPKLLGAWGLEMLPSKFAADRSSALRVRGGTDSRPEQVDYLAWLQLREPNQNKSDPVTGQLGAMIVATAGVLSKKEGSGAGTEITPLLHTTTNAAPLDTSLIQFMPDPKKLLADFKSGDKELSIAARITGKPKTAFPDGLPAADPNIPAEEQPAAPAGEQLKEATEPVNIIVVADCDMLADRFWVQTIPGLGLQQKISDNGDFVIGALDNLTGSSDLMTLRARGKFVRPFDKVEELRKNAEKNYAEKEQALKDKLRQTETEINKIQQQRPDGSAATILTAEQAKAIENYRAEAADTRKQLREVQHQLRKDIENLGTGVKVINMGLMPALIGLGAVALAGYRSTRRRTDRESIASKG